ncbi:MAG: retron system putative HNH endonuclease [Rhodospirillaceae bacterium]
MKYSAKQTLPSRVQQILDRCNTKHILYKNFRGEKKGFFFKLLLKEQCHVCAYCGVKLSADETKMHIDHFWPQSHSSNGVWDYQNWFASCGPPGKENRIPSTCGDAKGDWFDPSNTDLIPSNSGCEHRFRYGQFGGITAADSSDQLVTTFIDKLNLNDASLQYNRKAIIKSIESELPSTDDDIRAEIARWREVDGDGCAKSFGHVVANYLECEFGNLLV